MPSLNSIRSITIRARTEGAEQAKAQLDGVAESHDRLATATATTTTVTDTALRRQLSATAAVQKLRASIDEQFRSTQQLERGMRTLDRAFAQGAVDAAGYDRTLGLLESKYGSLTAASQRAADAQRAAWKDLGSIGAKQLENLEASRKISSLGSAQGTGPAANSNRLRGDQVQNLAYQASDVVSSLGSGGSLATVAFQQGPQIAQVFGGPGGASVRGAFAQAGEAASGLASRVGVVGGVMGGLGAAALTGVAAFTSYSNAQRNLQASLSGLGRASGTTVDSINAMAPAAAAAGNVSVRSAREMAGAFAATGKIGTEMYAGLIGSVKDYAATTGQELPDAAKMLAEAFADPTKGADDLNKQLGFLNDTTRENIQRLDAQGNRLGAQQALLSAYKSSLTSATELTSGWGRATASTTALISDAWDKLGKSLDRNITGGTLEDQLEAAKRNLSLAQAAQGSRVGGFRSPGSTGGTSAAEAEIKRVNDLLDQRNRKLEQSQTAQRSLQIGVIVRSTDPERQELKKLQDQAEQLRKAIADPIKFGLEKGTLTDTTNAFEGLSRAARNMADDIARFGSVATAALNRSAEFNNRTATFAPTAKAVSTITNDYAERERNADPRDLAGLRRARDLDLETQRQRTVQESSSGSGRYSMGVGQAPDRYRDQIIASSNASGVNADLLTAQIKRESSFNPNAVSSAGAQGISQFMPPTARGIGLTNAFDPMESIMKQGELMAQLLKQFNGNEVAALIGYNAGPRTAQRFLNNGSDTSTLPKETQGYLKAILTPPPNSEALVKAQVEQNAQRELERKNLEANAKLYGSNGKALETVTAVNTRLTEAQQSGITITESYAAAIRKSEAEKAAIAQQMATTRYGKDAAFEREQLGRSPTEQSAFSRARSVVGDTTSPAAQFIIEQEKMTSNMKDLKSAATDSLGGFATDLAHGATAMQALANQTTKWADKLLNLAADQAVTSLFKNFLGGGGSSGGGFGDILGSFLKGGNGGGSNDFGGGLSGVQMYAGGGVANSPSIFGEAGPEAAVPLPDGRRIPVHITTPPANSNDGPISTVLSPTFVTSIHTNGSSGDPAADRTNAEENGKQAANQAKVMMAQFVSEQMRPGGMLHAGGARRSNA